MARIVIVTGSARPGAVNTSVVEVVRQRLELKDTEVVIADLAQMALPFFDANMPPSAEGYEIPHESVKAWSQLISDADGVVFVAPEYNHSLSAIQKNAIDWLFTEWQNKPTAFVGYGWYGAKHTHENLLHINDVVKMKLGEKITGLTFMKEIAVDGSLVDEEAAIGAIDSTIDELLATV